MLNSPSSEKNLLATEYDQWIILSTLLILITSLFNFCDSGLWLAVEYFLQWKANECNVSCLVQRALCRFSYLILIITFLWDQHYYFTIKALQCRFRYILFQPMNFKLLLPFCLSDSVSLSLFKSNNSIGDTQTLMVRGLHSTFDGSWTTTQIWCSS